VSTDLRSVGFSEVRERLTANRLTVWEALLNRGPSTGSELAAYMRWTVLSVRPRVVELQAMYHAAATGERRDGEHVFRAVQPAEAMKLHEAARSTYALEMRAQAKEAASITTVRTQDFSQMALFS